jgi:hypothetical protein
LFGASFINNRSFSKVVLADTLLSGVADDVLVLPNYYTVLMLGIELLASLKQIFSDFAG